MAGPVPAMRALEHPRTARGDPPPGRPGSGCRQPDGGARNAVDGRAGATADGHGRARSRLRGWTHSGIRDVARRRARHRQVDAAAAAGRSRGPRERHAVPVRRGVGGPDRRARAPARRRRTRPARDRGHRSRGRDGRCARVERTAAHRRLDSDRAARLGGHALRRHHPAQGMHRAAGALREDHRHQRRHRRPRDEGWRDRRSAHARAPGRHRAVFRERRVEPLPQRARHQEPVRIGR